MAQKTQEANLKRTDAILEVYTDRFVAKCHGNEDLALIWVLQQDLTEFSVSVRIKEYLFIALQFCT